MKLQTKYQILAGQGQRLLLFLTHFGPVSHFYTPRKYFPGVQKCDTGLKWVNTKIGEVENKISDASKLVKKKGHDPKISEIEGNHFSTADYNKFTTDTLDSKTKTIGK